MTKKPRQYHQIVPQNRNDVFGYIRMDVGIFMHEVNQDSVNENEKDTFPTFPFNVLMSVLREGTDKRTIDRDNRCRKNYHLTSYIKDIELKGTKECKIASLLEQMQGIHTVHQEIYFCEEHAMLLLIQTVGRIIANAVLKRYKEFPSDKKSIAIGYTFCRPQDEGHLFILVLGDKMDSKERLFHFIQNTFCLPEFARCE